jgi:hypothetical protein
VPAKGLEQLDLPGSRCSRQTEAAHTHAEAVERVLDISSNSFFAGQYKRPDKVGRLTCRVGDKLADGAV